jgi:hypothetical protein
VTKSSQKEAALPAKGSNSTAGAKDKLSSSSTRSAIANANTLIKRQPQQNHHCNAQTFWMLLGQLQVNNLRLTWNNRQKLQSGYIFMKWDTSSLY